MFDTHISGLNIYIIYNNYNTTFTLHYSEYNNKK